MFQDQFESIVTTTKRNNRYYGMTESRKIASTLEEVIVDLKTVFNAIDTTKNNLEALASGYFLPSGYANTLHDLKQSVYGFEDKVNKRIYMQGEQAQVL